MTESGPVSRYWNPPLHQFKNKRQLLDNLTSQSIYGRNYRGYSLTVGETSAGCRSGWFGDERVRGRWAPTISLVLLRWYGQTSERLWLSSFWWWRVTAMHWFRGQTWVVVSGLRLRSRSWTRLPLLRWQRSWYWVVIIRSIRAHRRSCTASLWAWRFIGCTQSSCSLATRVWLFR